MPSLPLKKLWQHVWEKIASALGIKGICTRFAIRIALTDFCGTMLITRYSPLSIIWSSEKSIKVRMSQSSITTEEKSITNPPQCFRQLNIF